MSRNKNRKRYMVNRGKRCKIEGCKRTSVCRGYCKSHYIKYVLHKNKKIKREGKKNVSKC